MTELLTAAQMKTTEAAAIDSGSVTGLTLMERAGQGVVNAIMAQWPALARPAAAGQSAVSTPPEDFDGKKAHRAVVLCGPGNNGGDGFVVARLLAQMGWVVDVFFYGDAQRLPPDARQNHDRWAKVGQIVPLCDQSLDGYTQEHPDCVVAVDALFGTGLSRPFVDLGTVQDDLNYWQAASPQGTAPHVVAVDIVSGICADSGRYLGMDGENPFDLCVMANLTVTFHSKKIGHVLAEGPTASGHVVVCDIGLEPTDAAPVMTATARTWSLAKTAHAHKFTHGHALVLSGGVGHGGAARLAARGALRIGAGLVTVGCPPAALIENAAALDAIMLRRMPDAASLADTLTDRRINALCLGPGMGTGPREAALVQTAITSGRALVLDADALTVLSQVPDLFDALHDRCVLTPHAGEFARLFPDIADELAAPAEKGPAMSKVDATRAAAARAGCVVLLKGPDTVIADPKGVCVVNASVGHDATPWLATAGAGDVLAGFITGLLARGRDPLRAAETGAWLHTACARHFGPGLIAEDLPEQLPAVLRQLGV